MQYRESDLDFARRQIERAGISFHFRHATGSHTLVLTDEKGRKVLIPATQIAYVELGSEHARAVGFGAVGN